MSAPTRALGGLLVAFLGLQLSAVAQVENHRDWAETAVDDLHFIRATLRENHPGPVDPQNRGFRDWYKTGFARALERARRSKDYAGYFFSINYYTAGFHDDHLGALVERHLDDQLSVPYLTRMWPGFAVAYHDDSFVVDYVQPGASRGPRQGDALVSCDGRPANALAEEIVGSYIGLWYLRGEREELGPLLLVDEGNPFVRRPAKCIFRTKQGLRPFHLQWQAIAADELKSRLKTAPAEVHASLRPFGADGFWITVPSFDTGHEDSARGLRDLTAELRRLRKEIRGSSVVVFDVRGNRGGNSETGKALLAAIWGDEYIEQTEPRPAGIDWRVSAANLRFVKNYNLAALQKQFGADSPQAKKYAMMVQGMEAALQKGEVFYREEIPPAERPPALKEHSPRAVLLTDSVCASACLDFADIVLRLPGALHVGRETSADAVYMDNRAERLPSGLGWFGFSMKVDRGRARANNQSYQPAALWRGSIQDTKALEAWILQLNAGNAGPR